AGAMREAGESRLRDPRVTWSAELPDTGTFDRILCGAAIWQLNPLAETLAALRELLAPGGALVFDLPSLYLGRPDEPGGGRDPHLLELHAALGRGRTSTADAVGALPDEDGLDALLVKTGFRPVRWSFRRRMTQESQRDWLKIPVLTDALL